MLIFKHLKFYNLAIFASYQQSVPLSEKRRFFFEIFRENIGKIDRKIAKKQRKTIDENCQIHTSKNDKNRGGKMRKSVRKSEQQSTKTEGEIGAIFGDISSRIEVWQKNYQSSRQNSQLFFLSLPIECARIRIHTSDSKRNRRREKQQAQEKKAHNM